MHLPQQHAARCRQQRRERQPAGAAPFLFSRLLLRFVAPDAAFSRRKSSTGSPLSTTCTGKNRRPLSSIRAACPTFRRLCKVRKALSYTTSNVLCLQAAVFPRFFSKLLRSVARRGGGVHRRRDAAQCRARPRRQRLWPRMLRNARHPGAPVP